MSSTLVTSEGVTLPPRSPFPERDDLPEGFLDSLQGKLLGLVARSSRHLRAWRLSAMIAPCRTQEAALRSLDDRELSLRLRSLRAELHKTSWDLRTLTPVFAVISETAERTLGLRPHDRQLQAAYALLEGQVAELGAGEGKTLAAAIAAAAAALSGQPVHVVTAEEQSAERAAEDLLPLYRSLGLTLGLVTGREDEATRRVAYRSDVTYVACRAIAFDHLHDRMCLGRKSGDLHLKLERLHHRAPRCDELTLRGLSFAILDDADAILLDQAGLPLSVTGETEPAKERRRAEEALEMVAEFEPDKDFLILPADSAAELTDDGRARLADRAEAMGGIWRSRARREEIACLALAALHRFQGGEHYQLHEGAVEITDQAARSLDLQQAASGVGLKQLIETKEGCEVTGRPITLARTTLSRVFKRYHHLCGLTATGREAASAFWSEYRLRLVLLGDGWLSIRRRVEYVLPNRALQRRAVILRAASLQAAGGAVVIGVASPAVAVEIAQGLEKGGLSAVCLCTQPEADREELVSAAGRPGRITVATLTDLAGLEIPQQRGPSGNGGLHIILAECHASRRLDRRLEDCTARRGAPGRVEVLLALDDPLLQAGGDSMLLTLARLPGLFGQIFGSFAFRRAQGRHEAIEAQRRRDLAQSDHRLEEILAFTGGAE